jgi:CHAD domain-containing protein
VTLGRLVEDQVIAVRSGVNELRLDLGAVHDARVALRRLRATLSVFGDVLDPVPEGLGEDLRWFARQVGATRDAEVVAARLEDQLEAAPNRKAAEILSEALALRTSDAEAVARLALTAERTGRLLDGLGRLHLDAPAAGEIYHDVRASFLVAEALGALCEDLPAAISAVATPGLSTSRRARLLHERRKQVKTVRAVTSLLEVTAEDRSRLNKSLRQVQELLGDHHDAVVTRSWLAGVAAEEPVVQDLAKEIRRSERAEMTIVEEQLPWAVDRLVKRADRLRRTAGPATPGCPR